LHGGENLEKESLTMDKKLLKLKNEKKKEKRKNPHHAQGGRTPVASGE
jgi:hypothetical protein